MVETQQIPPPDANSNPELIARHAITVLEKKLAEQFGVELHAGVELECSYRLPELLRMQLVRHSDKNNADISGDLLRGVKRSGRYMPARKRGESRNTTKTKLEINFDAMDITLPPNHDYPITHDSFLSHTVATTSVSDSLFPRSNWVSYSYPESGVRPDGWVQYEHVISHEAPHADIPFGQGRMVVLARAVEALRKTIASTPPERHLFAKDALHNAWLDKVSHAVIERSTEALSPHGYWQQGMHFNLSLSHHGKPVLDSREKGLIMKHELSEMILENTYLLQPSPDSKERSKNRFRYDVTKVHDKRIEITEPGADCNPYYAVLVTLAGIYHALEAQGFSKKTGKFEQRSTLQPFYHKPHDPERIGEFVEQAPKRFFEGFHLLPELLDELEPELGSNFISAIKRTPPGSEKTREQAGIVGPWNASHHMVKR